MRRYRITFKGPLGIAAFFTRAANTADAARLFRKAKGSAPAILGIRPEMLT